MIFTSIIGFKDITLLKERNKYVLPFRRFTLLRTKKIIFKVLKQVKYGPEKFTYFLKAHSL